MVILNYITYTLVREGTLETRPIIFLSSGIHTSDPHWHCWNQGESPACKDTNLHHPSLVFHLLVPQRHLDSKQPVKVDKDKVVDGGTEKDDNHAGDKLAEVIAKGPSTNPDSVERGDETNQEICTSQGDHDQIESLKIRRKDKTGANGNKILDII